MAEIISKISYSTFHFCFLAQSYCKNSTDIGLQHMWHDYFVKVFWFMLGFYVHCIEKYMNILLNFFHGRK